ncbi:MAG: ion transporter [Pseudomonadota bacterium]
MKRATLDLDTYNSLFERAIESAWFRNFVTGLIILNAIILGILTYREDLPPTLVSTLSAIDQAVTYIFAVEIALKLFLYRLQFFKLGWNWFDFIVVGISLLPSTGAFSVLRALRVLRVLRLLHVVPMLRRITEALLSALPGMTAILAVLALVTYVGAVMATNMFGQTDTEEVELLFGSLPKSAYSLFQVMTMDGWRFEVVQKVIDDGHPYAWLFFLIFIFIASFAILNFFIALIVEALQAEQEAVQKELMGEISGLEEDLEHEEEVAQGERAELKTMLEDLKADVAALRAELADKKTASTE